MALPAVPVREGGRLKQGVTRAEVEFPHGSAHDSRSSDPQYMSTTRLPQPPSSARTRNTRFGMRPKPCLEVGGLGLKSFRDDGATTARNWDEAVRRELVAYDQQCRHVDKDLLRQQRRYAHDLRKQMKHHQREQAHEDKLIHRWDVQRVQQDELDLAMMNVYLTKQKSEMRERAEHNLKESEINEKLRRQEAHRRSLFAREENPWHFSQEVAERDHVKTMKQEGREHCRVAYSATMTRKTDAYRNFVAEKEKEKQDLKAAQEQYELDRQQKREMEKLHRHRLEERTQHVASTIEALESSKAASRASCGKPTPYTPSIFHSTASTDNAATLLEWRRQRLQASAERARGLDQQLQLRQEEKEIEKERRVANQEHVKRALRVMADSAQAAQDQQRSLTNLVRNELSLQLLQQRNKDLHCETDSAVNPFRTLTRPQLRQKVQRDSVN
jgi:hypothetical protein